VSGHELPRIGAPATRAMAAHGIAHLEDCRRVSRQEVLDWHGVGPKAVRLLDEALAMHGLGWAELVAEQPG